MIVGIIIAALVVILILWLISTQRKLVVLDENISNALSQIGVQLSSRFDALTSLLELTQGYAQHEAETLRETIAARRSVITPASSAADITAQENLITEALGKISMVAEQYPDLKANQNYMQTMSAVEKYEDSLRAARLIYNDSVTKLNRAVRMFPTSIVAGMLGFKMREYLETEQEKTARPVMK